MKITFIHHSSFCVELGDKVLVFDYFNGTCTRGTEQVDVIPNFHFQGRMPEFEPDQEIYMFVSHRHQDHFDPEIFRWADKYPRIRYIMPRQMKFNENYFAKRGLDPAVKERIVPVELVGQVTLEGLKIETFVSTDEGVAYLVSVGGRSVYHAGDLHWWHWDGEPEEFLDYQEKLYKKEMDRLAQHHVDVAFVVLDSRLDKGVFWGLDYFLEKVDADYVIPMHLWQRYELISQYKALPDEGRRKERVLEVTGENQVFVTIHGPRGRS